MQYRIYILETFKASRNRVSSLQGFHLISTLLSSAPSFALTLCPDYFYFEVILLSWRMNPFDDPVETSGILVYGGVICLRFCQDFVFACC